jgi:predicted phage terminase large subunit-like protein
MKSRAHWREQPMADRANADADTGSSSEVVLVLPDNNRDPELTQALRAAQQKFFGKKRNRKPPEIRQVIRRRGDPPARPGRAAKAGDRILGNLDEHAPAQGSLIMPSVAKTIISPQAGPQTAFLQTSADICIYGGAAGGGKTVGLIFEPLRYVRRVPDFHAVFYRRTTPQITNPGGRLLSLPLLERERLLGGNWKIRPAAGLFFKREWCAVVEEAPADLDIVRYWDLAAKTELNDPDWTVGIKLGRDRNGGYWLLDMVCARANPGDVERLMLNTATQDGKKVTIGFGQDPGQAGKSQAQHLVRGLSALTVRAASESGDKHTRFGPFSSQCQAGNVKILRGPWNEDLFRVLEGFPELAHDDEVDACSGALEMLNPAMKGWGYFEYLRQRAEKVGQRRETKVRLRASHGTGQVQTRSGRRLSIGNDGTVVMSAKDAEFSIPRGWTKLEEWEGEEDR